MPEQLLVLHENAFFAFFQPHLPEGAVADTFGGIGLLPGRDWPIVRQMPENAIWTVTEAEGEWWINPGVCTVNRHCYLVTQRAHDFKELLFKSSRHRPVLTPTGLRRQLAILQRVYASGQD